MNNKKPNPLYVSVSPRRHCPVCGIVSYSTAGIHPQCAQHQADQKRLQRQKTAAKSAKKSKKAVDNSLAVKAWHKRCPKCKAQVHIRKGTCDCGHSFAVKIAR